MTNTQQPHHRYIDESLLEIATRERIDYAYWNFPSCMLNLNLDKLNDIRTVRCCDLLLGSNVGKAIFYSACIWLRLANDSCFWTVCQRMAWCSRNYLIGACGTGTAWSIIHLLSRTLKIHVERTDTFSRDKWRADLRLHTERWQRLESRAQTRRPVSSTKAYIMWPYIEKILVSR